MAFRGSTRPKVRGKFTLAVLGGFLISGGIISSCSSSDNRHFAAGEAGSAGTAGSGGSGGDSSVDALTDVSSDQQTADNFVDAPGDSPGTDASPDSSTDAGSDASSDASDGAAEAGPPVCGNKIVEGREECDDGNTVNNDGCNNNCTFTCLGSDTTRNCAIADICKGTSTCSDTSHTCSTPSKLADNTPCGPSNTYKCKSGTCTAPTCGDGDVDSGEECDLGANNGVAGSGCTTSCKWVCLSTDATRNCKPANPCQTATCTTQHICSAASNVRDGTLCGASNKYCSNGTCTIAVCGNGKQEPGEACDDGFTTACGACNADCTAQGSGPGVCGDGVVCPDAKETCDEGGGYHDACGTCNASCTASGDGRAHAFCGCSSGSATETFQHCTKFCFIGPVGPICRLSCVTDMAGCAGSVLFPSGPSLCAPPCRPASAADWESSTAGAGSTPGHNYWTTDPLLYSGTATAQCSVSTSTGTSCNGGIIAAAPTATLAAAIIAPPPIAITSGPMHVCTDTQPDPEGNNCNWTQCGDTDTGTGANNEHFGGCGNTAGMLCVCP